MAKLINADALLESEIRRCGRVPTIGTGYINEKNFESILAETATVDAVEVVRCRDCKYWGDEDGILQDSDGEMFARCKAHNHLVDGRHTGWCPSENDFCSYGERKDGDGNG